MIATLWQVLGDPWAEPIMRRAFAEVVLLGVSGGALGCWVVLYGLSYSAESLAHALLPGLVVAALAGVPLLVGGAVGLALAAAAIAAAARVEVIGRDTAVAVVITTMLGLGVLLALSPDTPAGLGSLLFGDVLGVSDGDLALAGGLALVLAAGLWAFHGRLLIVGFDRSSARSLGARPIVAEVLLLSLLAAGILVAVQGLGNLLVVAVLIAPAAAARRLAGRVPSMMLLATAIAALAGVGGLYVSYHTGAAAGASIAGALLGAYALVGAVKASASAAHATRARPRRSGSGRAAGRRGR